MEQSRCLPIPVSLSFYQSYLGVHKQPPHKSHGGLESLALLRGPAMTIIFEVDAAEDELDDLVVECVQRLYGCGRKKERASILSLKHENMKQGRYVLALRLVIGGGK